jgi:2-polyprenyl-3-methyl-5-hydroxy-6-metoxy-1,4-benzoquinol methylase
MLLFLKRIKFRLLSALYRRKIKGRPVEEVFTFIFNKRIWKSSESVSGQGSELGSVSQLIDQLPHVFKQLNIKKMLDIPCGDFNWMRNTDLTDIDYTGADIVHQLVENNKVNYQHSQWKFRQMNIVTDNIEAYDLVFCRDCLVHFDNELVLKTLENIYNSGSRYFMATTFPALKANKDITTGEWRMINLELPPFNLPKPLLVINEGDQRLNKDKSMACWAVKDLKA